MSGIDLSTAAGALRFAELRRIEMRGMFLEHGRFEANGYSFQAYVFATRKCIAEPGAHPREWKPGAKLERVESMACRMPPIAKEIFDPSQMTEVFGMILREFSRATGAIGSVLMSEMWHLTMQGSTREEAFAEREKLPDSLEHAPGRREGLYCHLEHSAAGRHIWLATIARDPTQLGPWEEKPYTEAEGRLVDVTAWKS